MTLHELIKELIDISSQKLQIALNKYNEILAYRTAFYSDPHCQDKKLNKFRNHHHLLTQDVL